MTETCPVCGGRARLIFKLRDRDVYACLRQSCRLRFADPQPGDAQLSAYYDQYYYGGGEPAYENTPESTLRQLVSGLETRTGPLAGKQVLDFGCGIGTLCKVLLETGAEVDATEPDANARVAVTSALGIRVAADLDELRATRATYDLITLVDVVEHLRSPIETLAELDVLLKPGGVLFIETPDADSLKASVVGKYWGNYQNPTHLYYFNRSSLEYTLLLAGFESAARWRPRVLYPSHGRLRGLTQRLLQRTQLDGALRVLAYARPRSRAGVAVVGSSSHEGLVDRLGLGSQAIPGEVLADFLSASRPELSS